jgi:hypothetical protein
MIKLFQNNPSDLIILDQPIHEGYGYISDNKLLGHISALQNIGLISRPLQWISTQMECSHLL